jgi:prepilin-type N-terminal cleavage/methylation domain-containing protein
MQRQLYRNRPSDRGFSMLELLIVMVVIVVVAAIGIPSLRNTMASYRGSAAVQGIAAQLAVGKMRAAAQFTRSRITLDTGTNTYRREIYDKTTSMYQLEGGIQGLGNSVSFGYGGISAPAGGQTTIAQSTEIIFNSRGIPVDTAGVPVSTYAVYLNNDERFYAVTINSVGQIATWKYSGSGWIPQ